MKKAFTMVEVLIVIFLVAMMAAIVYPIAYSRPKISQLQDTTSEMVSQITIQRQNAVSRKNNYSYGVSFTSTKYTIYTGNSLATAVDSQDYKFPTSITASQITLTGGATEINFPVGTMQPNVNGTIQLKDNDNNIYYTEINSEGSIRFYKG